MERKYKSRYGADNDITAAQFIAEFILERKAKKEKTTLPFKFWNTTKWKKEFVMQTMKANELLKEYTTEEIFTGLNSKKGQRIYSLGALKTVVIPVIEENIKHQPPSKIDRKLDSFDTEYEDMQIEEQQEIDKKRSNLWEELE